MATRVPTPQIPPSKPATEGRISMAVKLASRNGSLTKDGHISNGFIEVSKTKIARVYERPGLVDPDPAWNGYGQGQGLLTSHYGGTGALYTVSGGAVGKRKPATRTVTLAGGVNLSAYTAALAKYADAGTFVGTYIVTVTAPITSADPATAALVWGTSWPGGCTFSLVANANVTGAGGTGGAGGGPSAAGSDGLAGGNAFAKQGNAVSVSGSGTIKGGGGGGGGGGGSVAGGGCGGGGGAGATLGVGGVGDSGAESGTDGTATTGGPGGTIGFGGDGGNGGNLEVAGTDGAVGPVFPTPSAGGVGGAAGQGIVA